jgi:hypothetical protein
MNVFRYCFTSPISLNWSIDPLFQDKALWMIAIMAPFLLQIIINLITIRSWWDFHNGTLGCELPIAHCLLEALHLTS